MNNSVLGQVQKAQLPLPPTAVDRPPGEIDREIEMLNKVVEAVECALSQHYQRILPIVRQEPEAVARDEKEPGSNTQLGCRLRAVNARLDGLAEAITQLTNRVEL